METGGTREEKIVDEQLKEVLRKYLSDSEAMALSSG